MNYCRWMLLVIVAAAACSDYSDQLTAPHEPILPPQPPAPLPIAPSQVLVSALIQTSPGFGLVYVSMRPGTLKGADVVRMHNIVTENTTGSLSMINGGFDPVLLPTARGDRIEVVVRDSAGREHVGRIPVPEAPVFHLVRTVPTPWQTDVLLNAPILFVFSEPVDPTSINRESMGIRQGAVKVPGRVEVVEGADVMVRFVPENPLDPDVAYDLVIGTAVRGVGGASLDSAVTFSFITQAGEISFEAIAAGHYHTCGLAVTGRAYCWGSNDYGAVGTRPGSDVECQRYFCETRPVAVEGGRVFRALAPGFMHTCGVTLDDEAFCWGSNHSGELGAAPNQWCQPLGDLDCTKTPTRVITTARFKSLAASFFFTCGIDLTGHALCWGENFAGQLGSTDTLSRLTPREVAGDQTFTTIVSGGFHACALDSDGAAWCWGANDQGQLGSSAQLEWCTGEGWGFAPFLCARSPRAVEGALRFSSLVAGAGLTCGLTAQGAAHCWGSGMGALQVPVAGGLRFASIAGGPGADRVCGLTSEAAAYCWQGISAPTEVPTPLRFSSLTVGGSFVCGVSTSTAYCWGRNDKGQLGDGTQSARGKPTRVIQPKSAP